MPDAVLDPLLPGCPESDDFCGSDGDTKWVSAATRKALGGTSIRVNTPRDIFVKFYFNAVSCALPFYRDAYRKLFVDLMAITGLSR